MDQATRELARELLVPLPGERGLEVLHKESRAGRLELAADGERLSAVSEEYGAAVRVLLADGRCGLAFTTAPGEADLRRALDEARRLARLARPDPFLTLPGAQGSRLDGEGDGAPSLALPTGEEMEASLEPLFTAARRLDPLHLEVERAWRRDGEARTWLGNSAGFQGAYRRRLTTVGILLRATLGRQEERLLHEESFAADPGPRLASLAERAARRVLGLVGGRPGGLGPSPILVLTPEAAAPMLEALSRLFLPGGGGQPEVAASGCPRVQRTGTAVAQGTGAAAVPAAEGNKLPASPGFAPAVAVEDAPPGYRQGPFSPADLGRQLAAESVNLVDDGLLPGGLSTAPFDGEGTPSATTSLVEGGRLRSLLLDRRGAARCGLIPTGNAVRDSYRAAPAPGITNFLLLPDPTRREEELWDGVADGLLAFFSSSPEQHELEAGLFSAVLRGRRIRRSRLEEPLSGVRLRLPLASLLRAVGAAGGDLRLVARGGCIGAPTVRLEGIVPAGT